MIITRVADEAIIDVQTLARAVRTAFPGEWRTWDLDDGGPMVWSVDVTPPGQPGFLVSLDRQHAGVYCDGTPEQCAAIAAVVAAVATGTSRFIAFDNTWAWHVDLFPGITPEQVVAGRVEHDEHWSDPELGGS